MLTKYNCTIIVNNDTYFQVLWGKMVVNKDTNAKNWSNEYYDHMTIHKRCTVYNIQGSQTIVKTEEEKPKKIGNSNPSLRTSENV